MSDLVDINLQAYPFNSCLYSDSYHYDNILSSNLDYLNNNNNNEFLSSSVTGPTTASDGSYANTASVSPYTTTSPLTSAHSSISPTGSTCAGNVSGNLSPNSTNNNQPQSQQQPQQQPPPQVPVPTASVMCCANSGRNSVTDPVSGQTVCSCQYDSTRINLSQYSHPIGVYSATPYPSTNQNPYQSIAMDSSAYFPSLSNSYALRDVQANANPIPSWVNNGLQQANNYLHQYETYGYAPAAYDMAARRKNATRESTATLKAWLNEHKKNPYPTKGEKIMLAIITKMTLTQVSTWFANARRRLKKENKMTWEPKNKTDDDDSDHKNRDDDSQIGDEAIDIHGRLNSDSNSKHEDDSLSDEDRKETNLHLFPQQHNHHLQHTHAHPLYNTLKPDLKSNDCGIPLPASKPKIWSLADTAACKTPPPLSQLQCNQITYHPQQQQQQQQEPEYCQQQLYNQQQTWSSSTKYLTNNNFLQTPTYCQDGFLDQIK